MDRDVFQGLIDDIYNAALNPDEWSSVLANIGISFNSIAAGFFSHSSDNQLISSFMWGVDQAEIDRYSADFAHLNPWFTTPGVMVPNRISTDRTLDKIHNNSNFFRGTVLYQDWGRFQDFRHSVGGALLDVDGNQLNFTFYRAEIQGEFTEDEIKTYQALSRHLMKALEITKKLQGVCFDLSVREQLLDRLNLGVVILDNATRVVYQNKFSEDRLGSEVNLFHRNILAVLSKAKLLNESVLVDVPRINRPPLSVCVLPPQKYSLMNSCLFNQASNHTLLIITDPESKDMQGIELIAKRWGFTKLEATIARQLLKGQSLRQIAEELNLALSTVQWYSKQLMQKVGVNRQAELCIALLKETRISWENLLLID